MYQETFDKIVHYRRSNRKFDPQVEVPDEVIRRSLQRAILSPNSSNMQLWEFHWIHSDEMLKRFVPLCLSQQAAATAKHLVVVVTRRDKWPERARWNLEKIDVATAGKPEAVRKKGRVYYGKLMPFMYVSDPFGIFGLFRRSISFVAGIFRPFYRAAGNAQQRITVHKSCALAAQTFMLSVAAEGFHTCPMEGFDQVRVKRALRLPRAAEINMIIAVGKGTEAGIWGPRFRVPLEEVMVEY